MFEGKTQPTTSYPFTAIFTLWKCMPNQTQRKYRKTEEKKQTNKTKNIKLFPPLINAEYFMHRK